MAGGNDEQKNAGGKGFAGLSSLVSDVDTTLPPPSSENPAAATGSRNGRAAPQSTQAPPSQHQSNPAAVQASSGRSSAGKWVLYILFLAVIGWLGLISQVSNNTATSSSDASQPDQSVATSEPPSPVTAAAIDPPQPSTAATSVFPGPTTTAASEDLISSADGATYRVPSYRFSELNADRQNAMVAQQEARDLSAQLERNKAILANEKSQVEQDESRLDSLGSDIELQRSTVDPSDQFALNEFNSKVNEYNSARAQVQHRISQLNSDVDNFNSLLQRARDQEQIANNLVDAFNTKLEQYGTRQ